MARTAPEQAASHVPVRTISSRGLVAGRTGNAPVSSSISRPTNGTLNRPSNNGTNQHSIAPTAPAHNAPTVSNHASGVSNTSNQTPRQRELSQNPPPSAVPHSPRTPRPPIGYLPPQPPRTSP